jgi:hypothetical protein
MSTDVMKLALAYVGQLARSYGPESEAYSVAEALSQAIEQAEQARPVWDASAPLVVHPHPAFQNAPPPRQPLTHPQIHELDWPDGVAFEEILLFARAIEAAHGIKEKT